MNKSIIEQNRLFLLAIIAFLVGIALIWIYFEPAKYDSAFTDEIVLSDQVDSYFMNDHMDILPDHKGQWTFEDVQSSMLSEQFESAEGRTAFGLAAKTYWIRTTITNQSSLEQWVIRLANPVVDNLDIYIDNRIYLGDSQLGLGAKINEHFWSYNIQLPSDLPVTIYMRATTDGSMIIPIELMDVPTFQDTLRNEYLFFGMFYGFILLMAAYLFSMFMFLRMVVYLYYSLYILFFGLSQLFWNGLPQEILGSDNRILTFLLRFLKHYEGIYLFFFILGLWFITLFLSKVLQLDIYAPQYNKLLNILLYVSPFTVLALLFHLPGYSNIAIIYELLVVLVLATGIVISLYRGNRATRYIVLAMIPLIGLATPAMLYTFGLMHYSVLSQKARNELLQNISHNIRSPLTVVQGGVRAMIAGIEVEPGGKEK
jgi:signal transduction histidine kinase